MVLEICTPPKLNVCYEYQKLMEAIATSSTRFVRQCAADLVAVLERWQSYKADGSWIYMPIMPNKRAEENQDSDSETHEKVFSFYSELWGRYSRITLRKALDLLAELKLIGRRRNPKSHQDRTYQYKLEVDRLKALLEDKGSLETLEGSKDLSEGSESTSKSSKKPNITTTNSSNTSSINTTNRVVVVNGKLKRPKRRKQEVSDRPLKPTSQEGKITTQPTDHAEDQVSAAAQCEKIEKLGGDLSHEGLKEAIKLFPQNVENAIAALEEYGATTTVKDPTLYLVKAIRRGWVPRGEVNGQRVHRVLSQWVEEARIATHHRVIGSTVKDGVEFIYDSQGRLWLWSELRSLSWEQICEKLSMSQLGAIDVPVVAVVEELPPPEPPVTHVDVSEILAEIEIQLRRLGWKKFGEELTELIKRNFEVAGWNRLPESQLTELLYLLQLEEDEGDF